MQCGLLDWGRVRQLNLAYPLWGASSGATLEIWDRHLDELLALFVDELHAHGGPLLDIAELKLHLDLYVATMGLAGMMIAPERILFRLPEAVNATGPRDPVFGKSEQARNFLHIFTNFMNLWHTHDFGSSLDQLLERLGVQMNGNFESRRSGISSTAGQQICPYNYCEERAHGGTCKRCARKSYRGLRSRNMINGAQQICPY